MIGGPPPTVEDLLDRADLGVAQRAVCIALVEHGINPDEIPYRPDAVDETGYLRCTGRILPDHRLEEVRTPWPDPTAWRDIRRAASAR